MRGWRERKRKERDCSMPPEATTKSIKRQLRHEEKKVRQRAKIDAIYFAEYI